LTIRQPKLWLRTRDRSEIDVRSPEQIEQHYLVERELADRLRHAPAETRRVLYVSVYEELFARVPQHPMLTRKHSPDATHAAVAGQLSFLSRFLTPESRFLELGAGDCALSRAVAGRVRQVYALEVSPTITEGPDWPSNFELILSDGASVPLPEGSLDVAYSNQLMEHLHPDDALEQLRNVCRALRPGGVYVCITPHRLSGPHDVSRYFDAAATGFHLVEYTPRELTRLFHRAGFSRVRVYLGGKGHFVGVHSLALDLVERPFGWLHHSLRQELGYWTRFGFLRLIRIVGTK
jgi:SAM-dependent methyltransferase